VSLGPVLPPRVRYRIKVLMPSVRRMAAARRLPCVTDCLCSPLPRSMSTTRTVFQRLPSLVGAEVQACGLDFFSSARSSQKAKEAIGSVKEYLPARTRILR